jgi:hypothetical protein
VRLFLAAITTLAWALVGDPAQAQIESGSDGSDGVFDIAADLGTVAFQPAALGLDADGDGVFHFTTIFVGAGTRLTLRDDNLGLGAGRPVIWLAQGEVNIAGTIDLNGEAGHGRLNPAWIRPSVPGAGGFAGGTGESRYVAVATAGKGPGGALPPTANEAKGNGGGHLWPGGGSGGGRAYGDPSLVRLVGGSGGSGGTRDDTGTGGGGAGGGAILIASSVGIRVDGTIRAVGGRGANAHCCHGGRKWTGGGGGGSGGAIRLVAPRIDGEGAIQVKGGSGGEGEIGAGETGHAGAPGRIRLEAHGIARTLGLSPSIAVKSGHPVTSRPLVPSPAVRLIAIGEVPVPDDSRGALFDSDVLIDSSGLVSLVVEASGLAPGTRVTVVIHPELGSPIVLETGPLEGTFARSIASTDPVQMPPAHSHVFVAGSAP